MLLSCVLAGQEVLDAHHRRLRRQGRRLPASDAPRTRAEIAADRLQYRRDARRAERQRANEHDRLTTEAILQDSNLDSQQKTAALAQDWLNFDILGSRDD